MKFHAGIDVESPENGRLQNSRNVGALESLVGGGGGNGASWAQGCIYLAQKEWEYRYGSMYVET